MNIYWIGFLGTRSINFTSLLRRARPGREGAVRKVGSKLGLLLVLGLVGASGRPLAAGWKEWLVGLALVQQGLAGAPMGAAGPALTDADGLDLEPMLAPVSVWGDLAPLGNRTGPAEEPKRGSVSGTLAEALQVYSRSQCPGNRDWTLDLPGGRGELPPPPKLPVKPDWNRYGRDMASREVAQAHVAQARTLAEDADYAFCRLVHRYQHPVERHRKQVLVRQMDDAMFLFAAMEQERQDLLGMQATFAAGHAEPGGLPLAERLGYVREALEAIQKTLDRYLAARMAKVDARLQGLSTKEARTEERTQAARYARPKVKKKAKATRLRGD